MRMTRWALGLWGLACRAGAEARSRARTLAGATDRWDRISAAGVLLLGAGLWRTFHVGIAMIVLGVLLCALGVAGAAQHAGEASARPRRVA